MPGGVFLFDGWAQRIDGGIGDIGDGQPAGFGRYVMPYDLHADLKQPVIDLAPDNIKNILKILSPLFEFELNFSRDVLPVRQRFKKVGSSERHQTGLGVVVNYRQFAGRLP